MRLKQWAGIGLVALSIAAMFLWESSFREKLMFRSVPVLAQDLAAGELITEDLIKLVKLTPESMVDGAADSQEAQGYIGMKAAVQLHKNQQLLPEYFSSDPPPSEGSASFVIESGWICSQSSLDEVGDKVSLYLVGSGEYLGTYRIRVLPSRDTQLELAAEFSDYLLIRGAALANGEGSIIVINENCK